MVDILIRGGTVVTATDTFEADVGITGERIVAVGDGDEMSDAETVVDATDRLVLPGVVDPHVHIDDMFSFDTYESASKAAALGGTTTFIDFAWQAWVGETSLWDEEGTLLEGIERKRDKAENPVVDFGLHAAITREDEAVFEEFEAVIEAGVPTFKLFTAYEFGLTNGFMDRTFGELADHDAVAVLHSEDGALCEYLAERFQAEGKEIPNGIHSRGRITRKRWPPRTPSGWRWRRGVGTTGSTRPVGSPPRCSRSSGRSSARRWFGRRRVPTTRRWTIPSSRSWGTSR